VKKVFPLFAAFLVINSSGAPIWQVLGYEIGVKSIAQNVVPANNSQIYLDSENGKTLLNGMDVSNLKEDLVQIQARGNVNEIKIGQDNGKFVLSENGISANMNYPITIDPAKNQLLVTTSSGNRVLAILPYEAVLSLMRARLIDNVSDNKISLSENSNGELQYLISGVKNVNLFNVATLRADINSSVSATNAEILKLDEPQWLKFFGFLFK